MTMTDFDSKANVVKYIVESLKRNSRGDLHYRPFSIICSVLLSGWYTYRYLSISKAVPHGSSEDLKCLTFSIIILNTWNLILAVGVDSIIFNMGNFKTILTIEDVTLEQELDNFLVNTRIDSSLNKLLMNKDLRLFAVIGISTLLFHIFSNGIVKCIEYISFIASYHEDEESQHTSHKYSDVSKVKKAVSFNEKTTTFNYSDSSLAVSASTINNANAFFQKFRIKRITTTVISFLLVTLLGVLVFPKHFLLNSTAILYIDESSKYVVRFDHLYFAFLSVFLANAVHKFVSIIEHPNVCNFPRTTSILTRFIWCYSCIILVFALTFMVFSNDLLINLTSMIACRATKQSNDFVYSPIQFFTSAVINFLSHSIEIPFCNDSTYNECTERQLIDALTTNFIWLKNVLQNCWLVLIFSSFVLFPLLIWVITIEFKLKQSRNKNQ